MIRDLGTTCILIVRLREVERLSYLPSGTFERWGMVIYEAFRMANHCNQMDSVSTEAVKSAIDLLSSLTMRTYQHAKSTDQKIVEVDERISRMESKIDELKALTEKRLDEVASMMNQLILDVRFLRMDNSHISTDDVPGSKRLRVDAFDDGDMHNDTSFMTVTCSTTSSNAFDAIMKQQ